MAIESAILNRLRGTGVIKHFGTIRVDEIKLWKFTIPKIEVNVNLVWNHIYALYLALVVGFLTMNVYAGLAVLVAYLVGESYGWGKWVGSLTRFEPMDKELQESCYNDDEGKGFPYIHYVANILVKERINYLWYCRVALALRGFVWWYPLYMLFAFVGLISYTEALVIGVVLGIAFPVACWIGTKIYAEGKIWIINYSRGWENQELVYGLFQGMCLWYVIIMQIVK